MATKTRSRADRWSTAITEAQEALEKARSEFDRINDEIADLVGQIEDPLSELDVALDNLRDVQSEYSEWYENMPEGLREGATGEKLAAITEIEFDSSSFMDHDGLEFEVDLDTITDALSEAEGAELPAGFGRD
jgi:chromosome segregation ATPase